MHVAAAGVNGRAKMRNDAQEFWYTGGSASGPVFVHKPFAAHLFKAFRAVKVNWRSKFIYLISFLTTLSSL